MIPIDNINVMLSFRKDTSFTKNDVPFKSGNIDWEINLIPYKEEPFVIGEDFSMLLFDKWEKKLYNVKEEFYTYNDNGTITIPGANEFVAKAGKYSIIIQQGCNTSYQATYEVVGATVCDIEVTFPPTSGNYVSNIYQEEGVYYALDKDSNVIATWTASEPTDNVEQKEYYAALFNTTEINVLQQRRKTDEELIELFGLQTAIPMENGELPYTIDQSAVKYATVGTYDVIFKFKYGFDIVCKINIYMQFVYDQYILKEYTQKLPNSTNFIDLYDLTLNFSNLKSINLNGYPAPTVDNKRHEWIGQSVDGVQNVDVIFEDVATLPDGRSLNILLNFKPLQIHAKNKEHQRFGFDVDSNGNIITLQNGFTLMGWILSFFDENNNVVYLNTALRINDVHYAKHVGSNIGITEFFVAGDTKLSGVEFEYEKTSIPYFLASKYTGDEDTLGSDDIALGIVRQDTSSISLVFGKEYTGSQDFNYALQKPLEMPIMARAKKVGAITESSEREAQKIFEYAEPEGGIEISSNEFLDILTIDKKLLTPQKWYNIDIEVQAQLYGEGTFIYRIVKDNGMLQTPIVDEMRVHYMNIENPYMNPPNIIKPYIFNDGENGTIKLQVRKNTSSGVNATVLNTVAVIYEK